MGVDALRQLMDQALAAVAADSPQSQPLPAFLAQVNEILKPQGVQIQAQTPPSPSMDTVGQLFSQALSEVDAETPQASSVAALLAKVNGILGQAGLEIGPEAGVQTTTNQPQEQQAPTMDQAPASLSLEAVGPLLSQAFSDGEKISRQTTQLPPVVERVNAILAPAGLALKPVPPAAAPMPVAHAVQAPTTDNLIQLLQQAVTTVAEGSAMAMPRPVLMEKVNTILARAGVAITEAKPKLAAQEAITPQQHSVPPPLVTPAQQQSPLDGVPAAANKQTAAAMAQGVGAPISPAVAPEPPPLTQAGVETQEAPLAQEAAPLAQEPMASGAAEQHVDLALADLAQGSQEKKAEIMGKNEALAKEWLASDQDATATTPGMETESVKQGGAPSAEALESKDVAAPKTSTTMDGGIDPSKGVISMETKGVPPVQSDPTLKAQPLRPHLTQELQQFAVEQISQGVLRGLRNSDHHLTLTMYPKELGEVKVDMQVRGNHIAVSFVMENQKVKEAMESSMGEFKDNLERRGFSLGAIAVSVDQQQHQNDGGKRFMAAWEQMQVTRQREERVAAATIVPPVNSGTRTIRTPQGGISLFV
jgi:hypothetical protein